MAFTYETVTPIIPYTTMRKCIFNGNPLTYLIKPVDGYVMHDTGYDIPEGDGTTENENITLGYRTSEGSVSINYDFSTTEMLDEAGNTVTAYGERQFFCKPRNEVPENQIFGTGNNETETM